MAARSVEASIDVAADPATAFAVHADVEGWTRWDPTLEAAELDGPFAAGTRGWLKPAGAPRTRIEIVEVDAPASFAVVARLPLCRMRFEHELVPIEIGTRVRHRVSFSGPLAAVFARLVGPGIERDLPATLAGLKAAAESVEDPSGRLV